MIHVEHLPLYRLTQTRLSRAISYALYGGTWREFRQLRDGPEYPL